MPLPDTFTAALSGKRPESGGRVLIMGILNTTPDSFSDGGQFTTEEAILKQTDTMVAAGADIIDVGGESTRPFAEPVSLAEELSRTIPAIKAIRARYQLPVSIDTTKSEVARQALLAGADIINDISACRFDPQMIAVAVANDCPVIIMHMQGSPRDMQLKPAYDNVVENVASFFEERIEWVTQMGLDRKKIILDPGIGFGKSVDHNLSLLKHLEALSRLGCPLLVGHSRKSFIGKVLHLESDNRDLATAALSAICVMNGVTILRVHDVEKTVQAVRMAEAVLAAP